MSKHYSKDIFKFSLFIDNLKFVDILDDISFINQPNQITLT